ALTAFGVGGVLADPKLELHTSLNGVDNVMSANDNWGTVETGAADSRQLAAAFTQVGAFPLVSGSRDAALLVTVLPGSYTAQVSGVNGATGVALVEIYETP